MKKVKTISVDLYEPSDDEKTLYAIEKSKPENEIEFYYYNEIDRHKTYLNLYGRLESGMKYSNKSRGVNTTIYIKNGKPELEDPIYYYTFDSVDAIKKLAEYKISAINERKLSVENYNKELYEEIKNKYSDKSWFK
jgi:hypothetical protein